MAMPMLQYEVAKDLYEELKRKIAESSDVELNEFYQEFLKSAVEYANKRASWSFMTRAEQIEDDASRSRKHDGYMAMLTAVCRNLGIEGTDEFMPDRKTKGDFACYLVAFLALEQR